MAIDWSVDEATGIGTVRVSGTVTVEEGIEALRGLWACPSYRYRMLLDAREHVGHDVDASMWHHIGVFTTRARPKISEGRTAFLVSRDFDFGMSRMAQALIGDLQFESLVTRSYDEAIAFLTEPAEPTP